MNTQTKVNKNLYNTLSSQEKKDAFKEIEDACTKKIMIKNGVTYTVDIKKVKEVFTKYFGGDCPLLDINAALDSGFNPLMLVSWLGYNDELKILLKLGANPTISADNTNLPMQIAASNKRMQTVILLAENNEEAIKTKNKLGQTPLMNAAEAGSLEIVKILVEQYDASLYEKDNQGKDTMDYAKERKYYQIESYLRYYSLETTLDYKDENKKINKI